MIAMAIRSHDAARVPMLTVDAWAVSSK